MMNMKINRIVKIATLSTVLFFGLCATVMAQSAVVKKAAQSVFTLTTFASDGSLLATTHGVFVSNTGEAVSAWKPFVGAAKAVVIDASGKKYDVDGLIGANDIYNVCKFHVSGNTNGAKIATAPVAAKTQQWVACYAVKSPRILHAQVSKVEQFMEKYSFYILDVALPEGADYCPLVNDAGEVLALVQPTATQGTAHAVDASFVSTFFSSTLSGANQTLSKSLIPMVMPDDLAQARLSMFFAQQQRSAEGYNAVIEQFINKFPKYPDGYAARARQRTAAADFDGAASDMQKAISVAEQKGDQHYAYSQLILDKEIYMSDKEYAGWSLALALDEARQAQASEDLPIYVQQQAKVLYAMERFDEAYELYMKLQQTSLAGPETMFAALDCRQSAGAQFEELIMLMDSVVATCPKPLTYKSAPYILQRAMMYHDHGDYRKAMLEYMDYEKLMVGQPLKDDFYYIRYTCERDGRQYQQALTDIDKAISINAYEPLYFCEKASLLLKVNKIQEAIDAVTQCLIIDPKNADAHAILGTAQCLSGKKHEGMLNLQEAKSLGYEGADELIKRYAK